MKDRTSVLVQEGDSTARYIWRDAKITWLSAEVCVEGTRVNGLEFTGTATYPRERVLSIEEPAR